MAIHVLKRSLEDKNFKVTLNILPNFGARFIGSFLGKKYESLPRSFVMASSMSKKIYNI